MHGIVQNIHGTVSRPSVFGQVKWESSMVRSAFQEDDFASSSGTRKRKVAKERRVLGGY